MTPEKGVIDSDTRKLGVHDKSFLVTLNHPSLDPTIVVCVIAIGS